MELRNIADRMRWARRQLKMTQDDLSAASGVSKDVIAQIEIGRTKIPRQAADLAGALKVSPGWLVFGEEMADKLDEETIKLALKVHALPDSLKAAIQAIINSHK